MLCSAEPPLIQKAPLKERKAAEGQTIQLSCVVFGSPKPVVVWHKGDEQLTGGRFKVMHNGNLQILVCSHALWFLIVFSPIFFCYG